MLKLRPGITGPATLKYRLEDEQIAAFVAKVRNLNENEDVNESGNGNANANANVNANSDENANLGFALPENVKEMSDQELAVWYNDNVIYPDKVRLNCCYYRHYSFWKDIEMIFATVLGRNERFFLGGYRMVFCGFDLINLWQNLVMLKYFCNFATDLWMSIL